MGKWLSMSNTLVWVLTIFFSASGIKKLLQGPWDRVGLDLIWPASFCNLTHCKSIKTTDFSIESLAPLYSTTDGEVYVPPFDEVEGCVSRYLHPCAGETITKPYLGEMFHILHNRWADLQDRENDTRNIENWKSIWYLYGKCFGEKHPIDYFRIGLNLEDPIEMLSIFTTGGCPVGFGCEKKTIESALHTGLQVYATVICSTNKEGDVLLLKVRICYNDQLERIDCTRRFHSCGDGDIMFPAPPE